MFARFGATIGKVQRKTELKVKKDSYFLCQIEKYI